MTPADVFYRAYRELEKLLGGENATAALLSALARAPEAEDITVTHNVCTVEEDWIAAIERGLVFIGKAIDEDRQFIRSDGEVQPIEKVRHVSKESVQHLSRHSDLIPEEQRTDEDIVPNKLYTVERLNDYAVYENRFLYVLLLRIRDFVAVRYEAIMRAYRSYRGEYTGKKTLVTGTRRFTYEVRLADEQDDVVSAPADKACAACLDRLDKIRMSVAFYLRTPLMAEVSHADKIKSKVTKTNVLRMNKNFREALRLYEFLLAYEGDGYAIERRVEKLDPVPEDVARAFAVPAVLTAHAVFEHGLGLEGYLAEEYEKEEARRAEEEKDETARKLKALKKRIKEAGGDAEAYMLLLERANAALEEDRKALKKAQAEIADLQGETDRLRAENDVFEEDISRLNEEMRKAEEEFRQKLETLQRECEEKLAALRAAHEEELSRLTEAHRAETEALKAAQAEEISRLNEAHRTETEALKAAQAETISRLNEAHRAETEALKAAQAETIARAERAYAEERARVRAEYDARLKAGESALAAREREAALAGRELSDARERLYVATRQYEVLRAEMTAIRKEHGLLGASDDFTTEEGFNALEHEFEVLGRLVRDEWTDVRKMLRKEFYGGIRAAMHAKKPQKSKEYIQLCDRVNALKDAPAEAAAEQPAEDGNAGEESGTDGET